MPITNFPYGLSSYGAPVLPLSTGVPLGGPTTSGGVWWVDNLNGSAANGGTGPTDALLTITAALAKCTASGSDIIFVQPGTYTTTASITVNKAGVTIIGLGDGRPGFGGVNITASAVGAALVKIAANNVTLSGLTFTGEAARAIMDCSVTSSFANINNCEFIVPDSTTATAVSSTAAWTESVFQSCVFKGLGTITTLVALNGNNNLVQDCLMEATVSGKTITTGILAGATTIGLVINRLTAIERDSAVFTAGVDLSAGTYNLIQNSNASMGTMGNFVVKTGTGNHGLSNNVASGSGG
jgi:hypothetical protein